MANGALEQSALEAKDREQLVAIAAALGVKSASRAKKSELIDAILEQTKPNDEPAPRAEKSREKSSDKPSSKPADKGPVLGADGEPLSEWEIELAEHEGTPIAPDARRQNNDRRNDRGDRGDRVQVAAQQGGHADGVAAGHHPQHARPGALPQHQPDLAEDDDVERLGRLTRLEQHGARGHGLVGDVDG